MYFNVIFIILYILYFINILCNIRVGNKHDTINTNVLNILQNMYVCP